MLNNNLQRKGFAWWSTFSFFLLLLVFVSNSCTKSKTTHTFITKPTKVALVVSGPINDSSWNSAAYGGLKRFKQDYNAEISVVDKVDLKDAKYVLLALAEKKYSLIIANGYKFRNIIKNISKFYPETFFCVIGGEIAEEPNLCSFNFKDEQYGYILGVVAGLNTSTNKVGIVVGEKMPSIEKVILGMRKGLKFANPKADLVVSYINSWDDIAKGTEAGIAQINTGVDVITHIADQAGIGVIRAAEDSDISAIGAIVDQHDLAPSTVITSGIQDGSQLVYLACEYYVGKVLEPTIYQFGLKDQVIDITPSYGNIDPTLETKINRIKSNLIDLEIVQAEELEKRRKKRNG